VRCDVKGCDRPVAVINVWFHQAFSPSRLIVFARCAAHPTRLRGTGATREAEGAWLTPRMLRYYLTPVGSERHVQLETILPSLGDYPRAR